MIEPVYGDLGWVETFGTGHASVSKYSRLPSEKKLARWAKEDARAMSGGRCRSVSAHPRNPHELRP